MTGRPGDGCTNPEPAHAHWCGFCGAQLLFSPLECQSLPFVPHCPRCRETDWRTDPLEDTPS